MLRLPTKMNFGKPSKGSSASISLDDHEAKVGELNDQLATVVAERDQAKKEAAENLTLAETADAKVQDLTQKLADAEDEKARLAGAVHDLKGEVEKLEASQSDFDEKVQKEAAKLTADKLAEHGDTPLDTGGDKPTIERITPEQYARMSATDRAKFLQKRKEGKAELI